MIFSLQRYDKIEYDELKMKKLWICYKCQIHEDGRQSEQEGVHAVEYASVSRYDVS